MQVSSFLMPQLHIKAYGCIRHGPRSQIAFHPVLALSLAQLKHLTTTTITLYIARHKGHSQVRHGRSDYELLKNFRSIAVDNAASTSRGITVRRKFGADSGRETW